MSELGADRASRRRFLAASAAMAAGVAVARSPAAAQALATIRFASAPDDDATPVLYAQQAGLFRMAGYTADMQRVNNGSAVAAAIAGGAVDIGKVSTFSVILAHARGVPLTMVAPGALASGAASGLLVLRDGPIRSAKDLSGKVVSVPALNDMQALSTRAWIDQHGGSSKDVQFIEEPVTAVGVALDGGRIAAGTLSNPAYAEDMATGKYRDLGAPIDAIGHVMISAWVATTDYAAKNPAVLRAFGRIIAEAATYCNAHPERTVDLLSAFSGMDAATIAHMDRSKTVPRLDPALVQPFIEIAAKYGTIPHAFDARELFRENA